MDSTQEKTVVQDVFGNLQKVDEKTNAKALADQISIDHTFKWVRYGLSMLFTILLLCLFSLLYVRPGNAAFYVCIMTLVFVAVGFAIVVSSAKKAGRKYLDYSGANVRRGKDE